MRAELGCGSLTAVPALHLFSLNFRLPKPAPPHHSHTHRPGLPSHGVGNFRGSLDFRGSVGNNARHPVSAQALTSTSRRRRARTQPWLRRLLPLRSRSEGKGLAADGAVHHTALDATYRLGCFSSETLVYSLLLPRICEKRCRGDFSSKIPLNKCSLRTSSA